MHRFVLLLERLAASPHASVASPNASVASPHASVAPPLASVERVELLRSEPILASAIVGGIRDVESDGLRVIRILDERERRREVLTAADLIVRLRGLRPLLSEEEMALLLDLLQL